MKILDVKEVNSVSGGFWNWVSAAFTAYDAYERLEKMHKARGISDKDDPTYGVFGETYSDLFGRDRDSNNSNDSNSSSSGSDCQDSSNDRREEREARNNF